MSSATGCDPACGRAQWLGVAGTCANRTVDGAVRFFCQCPSGFSGSDDWAEYGDCHVKMSLQRALWIANIAMSAVVLVTAAGGLVFLVFFWDFAPPALRRGSSALAHFGGRSKHSHAGGKKSASGSSNESPSAWPSSPVSNSPPDSTDAVVAVAAPALADAPEPINRSEQKLRRRKLNRQRITLLSLLLLVIWGGCMEIYYWPFLFGQTRAGHFWYQDLAAACATNSLFVALWFFFWTWYGNLPSLRLYGRLFGVDSILIRRPQLIKAMVACRVVIINVVTVLLLGGLDIVGVNAPSQRALLDRLFLWWCCALSVDFAVNSLVLCAVLGKLFDQLVSLSTEALHRGVTGGGESKIFATAIATIKLLRRAVVLLMVPAAAIFALSATFAPFHNNLYVAINANIAVANVGALIVCFIYVARMRGVREVPKSTTAIANASDAEHLSSVKLDHTQEPVAEYK
jgi:hypothetical protein